MDNLSEIKTMIAVATDTELLMAVDHDLNIKIAKKIAESNSVTNVSIVIGYLLLQLNEKFHNKTYYTLMLLEDILNSSSNVQLTLTNWEYLENFFLKESLPKKIKQSLKKILEKKTESSIPEDIRKKQVDRYKKYRIENNLPVEPEDPNSLVLGGIQKMEIKENGTGCIKKTLPKELKVLKNQRIQLNESLKDVREIHHRNYESNNGHQEIHACKGGQCIECKRVNSSLKKQDEPFILKKRLPPELQKSKDSKLFLKKEVPKVLDERKQKFKFQRSVRSDENRTP